MTGYLRLFTTLCTCILSFHLARAQEALPDSAVSGMEIRNNIDAYHRYMGQETRLLNGPEHLSYLPMNGHPFFQTDSLAIGSIVYEGLPYPNTPMLYDIVRDELVVPNPNGELLILSNQKVKEFFFLGHHFVRYATGYYDQLAAGKVILLAKRYKVVIESIEGLVVVRNIESHDDYYLVKDGVQHSIGSLKSLLSLVKDRRKDINQDLKKKNIRYRKQHEAALVEAVTYYNQLTHP